MIIFVLYINGFVVGRIIDVYVIGIIKCIGLVDVYSIFVVIKNKFVVVIESRIIINF